MDAGTNASGPARDAPQLTVTALIVVRNERDSLQLSLGSLLAQDLPPEQYEILVVDGQSTDGTVEEARRLSDSRPEVAVRILENPRRSLAAGWNIGVREAAGEYVVRIDAHAAVPPTFLRQNVALHTEHDVACTGGPMATKGGGYWGGIVAAILSSRFGVGSSFRTREDYEGLVDTVAFGMYRRSALLEAGLFNEGMGRNQDLDLHWRMRQRGARFYMSPRVRSTYYSRSAVRSMVSQAFSNGYWHAASLRAMSGRHMAPALAGLLGAAMGVVGLWYPAAWILLAVAMGLHLSLGALSAMSARLDTWTQRLFMPPLFVLLHGAYGLGTLTGIASLPFRRRADSAL